MFFSRGLRDDLMTVINKGCKSNLSVLLSGFAIDDIPGFQTRLFFHCSGMAATYFAYVPY